MVCITKDRRDRVLPQERDEIVRLYSDGIGFNRIAVKLNRNSLTVKRTLLVAGIPIRKSIRPSLTEEQKDFAVSEYKKGVTAKTIGNALGREATAIRSVLVERGVDARSNSDAQTNRRGAPHRHIPCGELGRKRLGAEHKGIPWTITIDDFEAAFDRQNGRCFYSGIPMLWASSATEYQARVRNQPLGISIDRRDSSLGYTPDNIALCCMFINYAKNDWSEAEFRAALSLIAKYSP